MDATVNLAKDLDKLKTRIENLDLRVQQKASKEMMDQRFAAFDCAAVHAVPTCAQLQQELQQLTSLKLRHLHAAVQLKASQTVVEISKLPSKKCRTKLLNNH